MMPDDKAAEFIVDDMFGLHGDKAKTSQDLTASRIHIEECTIENADMTHIQTRNKIDRFTGGTFETALMSEQPVFAQTQTQVQINLELQIPMDEEDRALVRQETGLLLLLLKDLWTKDLPLGGESSIGRGCLKGLSAKLQIGTVRKPTVYKFNATGLANPDQADELQKYVAELWGQACHEN